MSESYFVTGALGCIGAWVAKAIVERGDVAVCFDPSEDRRRLLDVMDESAFARVRFVHGDVTDFSALRAALEASGARKVIHLAGLQVPFCRADPARGARVNVLGTIHVFEAAKALALERVVYASSAAVYGPPLGGEVPDESAATEPRTHYGVYKRANEQGAHVYWRDDRVASVGLRPLTVYGVGRDQGLTSAPTSAMKAAVLGRSFHIAFSGATDFCYVADAAVAFLASADRAPPGAHVYNLHGITAELERLVELIDENAPDARGRITFDGPELPLPPELDGGALERALPGLPKTALADGVRETMERFRALLAAGRLDVRDV